MKKIFAPSFRDYELIDAGGGKKLERWGSIITIRPEVNAYFKPHENHENWRKQAHAEFVDISTTKGRWKFLKKIEPNWAINYNDLIFKLKFGNFKHLGIFPEQSFNWNWINGMVKSGDKVLNLFAYTGAASIATRKKGAEVYHVDSIKSVNEWAKANMESSGLTDIRWVTEDALTFMQREIRRDNKYDHVFMDPPAFGISSKGKRWKIENEFKNLISLALSLVKKGGHILLNTYSPRLAEHPIQAHLLSNKALISNYSIDVLCIKTSSGKRLEYGLRTLIKKST